eukprot:scaffold25663_cov63-Phaeocystis_antarctica.AAC.4
MAASPYPIDAASASALPAGREESHDSSKNALSRRARVSRRGPYVWCAASLRCPPARATFRACRAKARRLRLAASTRAWQPVARLQLAARFARADQILGRAD